MLINEDGTVTIEEKDTPKPRWIPTTPWPEFKFVCQKGIFDIYIIINNNDPKHSHRNQIGKYITLKKTNSSYCSTWWGRVYNTIQEIPSC